MLGGAVYASSIISSESYRVQPKCT